MTLKKWIRIIMGLYFVLAGYTLLARSNTSAPFTKENLRSADLKQNGVVAKKPIAETFYFKNAELYSDFLNKKIGQN